MSEVSSNQPLAKDNNHMHIASVFSLHLLDEIVLASASPRRRQLLELAKIPFTVLPATSEEPWDHTLSIDDAIMKVAAAKARDVRSQLSPSDPRLIVSCDTAVVLDNRVFGKPSNREDAASMIRALSGRTHQVKSAVCIIAGVRLRTFVETTNVTFYKLTENDIEAYLDHNEYSDKAGAYGIQGMGALLVSHLEGDYFNVVGFPLARIARMLVELQ